MQTTFHESYGDVSPAQLRAYKKYNINPADHDALVRVFGESRHDAITRSVITYSDNNMFNVYRFEEAMYRLWD